MTYRIEIYRPHPDAPHSLVRDAIPIDGHNHHLLPQWMRESLRSPGAFALVIRIDGDEETVLERWRVAAQGRILRSVYDVRERELEQT
ncbi:MAG TPA: hypothetical protein VFB99_20465 [Vicinamibacterales bacterium]|nr:hypothetical protein [Vicinamibacterales bacterium]